MTLMGGSRQFAAEGEPVTRHVFKVVGESPGIPVYGLFVARDVDANTAEAFHNARYFRNWDDAVATPVVALKIDHVLALINLLKVRPVHMSDFKILLEQMLDLQKNHACGPAWCSASWELFDNWVTV
jgi:ABC-type phosphate/phosphonate transport system substrate-binding protein